MPLPGFLNDLPDGPYFADSDGKEVPDEKWFNLLDGGEFEIARIMANARALGYLEEMRIRS